MFGVRTYMQSVHRFLFLSISSAFPSSAVVTPPELMNLQIRLQNIHIDQMANNLFAPNSVFCLGFSVPILDSAVMRTSAYCAIRWCKKQEKTRDIHPQVSGIKYYVWNTTHTHQLQIIFVSIILRKRLQHTSYRLKHELFVYLQLTIIMVCNEIEF